MTVLPRITTDGHSSFFALRSVIFNFFNFFYRGLKNIIIIIIIVIIMITIIVIIIVVIIIMIMIMTWFRFSQVLLNIKIYLYAGKQ